MEKPQLIPCCGENELKVFGLATRQWHVDQKYEGKIAGHIWSRSGQELTKRQLIALQEHAVFHQKKGDIANLSKHIELMRLAIKEGLAFIEAHMWALNNSALNI